MHLYETNTERKARKSKTLKNIPKVMKSEISAFNL